MDTWLAPIDRIAAVDVPPGGHLTLRGSVTTSVDGSTFDGAMQWDGLSPGAAREPGLFDLEAGGLHVVERHPERHEYAVVASGAPAPVCARVGAQACLVPRLAALAHERLRTVGELGPTLSGGVAVEGPHPPTLGSVAADVGVRAVAFVGGALVVAALGAVLLALHRRSRSAFARTRRAARQALSATRGDPSLAHLHAQIGELTARALLLESSRRKHARHLRRLDRVAIQARVDARARAGDAGTDVLQWLGRELEEAGRLEREHAACVAGLERIESALRVVSLKARDRHDLGGRRADPVDAVGLELELRDAALAEADRASV